MRKLGFTMIELIFVIVILGILAAVAIPKLNATRTDAKVSAIATQVQSAVSEIPQYVTAHGGAANSKALKEESQVIKQLITQDKAKEIGGNEHNVTVYGDDKKGCVRLETNDTSLIVETNKSATGPICTGIKNIVKDMNYTVTGSSVTY